MAMQNTTKIRRGDYCRQLDACTAQNRTGNNDGQVNCMNCKGYDPFFKGVDPAAFAINLAQTPNQKKKGDSMAGKKTCTACGKTLPLTEKHFKRHNRSKDKFMRTCLACNGKKSGPAGKTKPVKQTSVKQKECKGCNTSFPADKKHFQRAVKYPDNLDVLCKSCRSKSKAKKKERSGLRLVLDFNDCPDVLEDLKKFAADQERTPEGQVRFFLRKYDYVRHFMQNAG